MINSILGVLPKRDKYLEVGIFKGATFQNVYANEKWGVDIDPAFDISRLPNRTTVFVEPSDNFFSKLSEEKVFDMIYIDAEHTFDQAYREFVHAMNHLENWGVILLDDTVPFDSVAAISDESESKREALRVHQSKVWSHQGDVWKLIFQVKNQHKDVVVRTIVGPSRPRTIMWRADSFGKLMKIESTEGSHLLSYSEVFASGIPADFCVKELSVILAEISSRNYKN